MSDRYRQFSVSETLQAITVEVIRRVWDAGRYRDNEWAKRVHDNWFDIWVEWRTQITMRDVDAQAEALVEMWEENEDPAIDAYRYSEALDGETLLGGPMQLSHPTLGSFDDIKPTDTEDGRGQD